jgi:hypothetical protein
MQTRMQNYWKCFLYQIWTDVTHKPFGAMTIIAVCGFCGLV